jgi:hypothetical protein
MVKSIDCVDFRLFFEYSFAMSQTLEAKITKKTKSRIRIEITKESFEAFCDAIGLYKKEFLEALDASDRDHRAGRVTKRKSLHELID